MIFLGRCFLQKAPPQTPPQKPLCENRPFLHQLKNNKGLPFGEDFFKLEKIMIE